MSRRESHRVLEQELRLDRREAGLPRDPSHRAANPVTYYPCTGCNTQHRQPFQLRIHQLLGTCLEAVSA